MKKTKLPFILLVLLVLFLALAGAACDGGFAAVSLFGSSGVVGTDLCLWGKGKQLALQDALWDSLSLPRSDSSEGNFSPMGADQGDLVSPEGGWQVVTSHTHQVREVRSFSISDPVRPGYSKIIECEVGFDLNVSLAGGHEFLAHPDDFDPMGPGVRFRIYVGKGAVPLWNISNIIQPPELSGYYTCDPPEVSGNSAKVKYVSITGWDSVSVSTKLFAHELSAVNMITRNKAGEESPARNLNSHALLGVDLFNARIKVPLECVQEDHPSMWGPRAGQEARNCYYKTLPQEKGAPGGAGSPLALPLAGL